MYESFFGISERPFAAAPVARNYFPAAAIESARQTLSRCIERAEGVGLLVGPAGTGKTLLCHVLAEQLRGHFLVALLESGRLCTHRALLQAILFEIGLPYRGMEEGDLRLSLVDHLSPRAQNANAPGNLLLMIDEAHSLPLRLLEELRLISNLVRQGQPRVRLLLAGGPQLEERLASPKLESFNQRIAARCYLEALDRAQTVDYVRHHLRQAGGQPERIFSAEASAAVYQATDGIPRLINQVCDHAMILACAGGAKQLSAAGIEEAWSDLQQLPTPWNAVPGAAPREATPGVVEFGELDDEPSDDLPSAVPFRRAKVGEELEALDLDETDMLRRREKEPAAAGDEDFQPAGSIGPEVELVFQQAANPFHEAFEEEEVVLDPYAAAQSDAFVGRPVVRSDESHEFGAMLTPITRDDEMGGLMDTPWPGGLPSKNQLDSQLPENDRQDLPPSDAPSDDFAEPEHDELDQQTAWRHLPRIEELETTETSPLNVEPVAPAPESEPATHQPAATEPPAAPVPRPIPIPPAAISPSPRPLTPNVSEDLIVVEDPPWKTIQAEKKPAAPPRKQEFRHLFARLRRE